MVDVVEARPLFADKTFGNEGAQQQRDVAVPSESSGSTVRGVRETEKPVAGLDLLEQLPEVAGLPPCRPGRAKGGCVCRLPHSLRAFVAAASGGRRSGRASMRGRACPAGRAPTDQPPSDSGACHRRAHRGASTRRRQPLGVARDAVPHRGRRIIVDRTEVPLAVDQRVPQREGLREADQRVVDRRVAVRVMVAHHVADDVRATSRTAGPGGCRSTTSSRGRAGGPASARRAHRAARGRR